MSRPVHRNLFRTAVAGLVSWCVTAGAEAPRLTFVPFNPSGIYEVGEKVGWNVVLAAGTDPASVDWHFTLRKNDLETIKSGRLDFTAGRASIETILDEPAMLYVEVASAAANGPRMAAGAAVGPTKLQPSAPCPDDFDSFWAAKIKLLTAVPAEPVLTPGESGTAGVAYSTVKLGNINGAHVYGQLARPAGKGKHPAMLVLQWANPPYPLEKGWVTAPAAAGWIALSPTTCPGTCRPPFTPPCPK